MRKAEVLKALGLPKGTSEGEEFSFFTYRGAVCSDPYYCAIRFNAHGLVDELNGVDYHYTEVMK